MSRSKRSKKHRRPNHHQNHPSNNGKTLPAVAELSEPVHGKKDTHADVPVCQPERGHVTNGSPRPHTRSDVEVEPIQLYLSPATSVTPPATLAVSDSSSLESLLDGLAGAHLRTGTLILQALRKPEDLSQLRRLAVTHGFVNDRIRAVVWPRLLGLNPPSDCGLQLGQLPSMLPLTGTARWSATASAASGESLCQATEHLPAENGTPRKAAQEPSRQHSSHASEATGAARGRRNRISGTTISGTTISGMTISGTTISGTTIREQDSGGAAVKQECGGDDCGRGDVGCSGEGALSGTAVPKRDQGGQDINGCMIVRPGPASVAGDCARDGCGGVAGDGTCVTSPTPSKEQAATQERSSSGTCRDADTDKAPDASPASDLPAASSPRGPTKHGSAQPGEQNRSSSYGGGESPQGAREELPPEPSVDVSSSPDIAASAVQATQPGNHSATAADRPNAACADAAWQGEQGNVPAPPEVDLANRASHCSSCGGALSAECSSSKVSQGGSGSLVPEPSPVGPHDRELRPQQDWQPDSVGDVDQDRERSCSASWPEWEWDWTLYLRWSEQPHRDSAVVEVDVARSMWAFTRGLSDEEREARRQQLKRLLNAVVAAHAGDVFYYQGLHDVASVLLLSMPGWPPPAQPPEPLRPAAAHAAEPLCPQCASAGAAPTGTSMHSSGAVVSRRTLPETAACARSNAPLLAGALDGDATVVAMPPTAAAFARGELLAFALLHRLVTTHLRDATRPSLEPVVQLLGLVPYLVHAADPALSRHLGQLGLQPFFALSWFLTWWAHELDDLAPAARLFDFFFASHPLMPLYLGAVAMRSQRAALLACEDMPELHSALTNLKLVAADGGSGCVGTRDGRASGGGWATPAPAMSLEDLLRQADQLWRAKPPHTLLPARLTHGSQSQVRQRRGVSDANARRPTSRYAAAANSDREGAGSLALTACVAHAARMEGRPALWRVPDAAPAAWPSDGSGAGAGLSRVLARANSALGGRSRTAMLSTALLAGVYVVAAVAIGYATFSRATMGQQ